MLGIKLKRVDARRVELWDGAQFAGFFFWGGGLTHIVLLCNELWSVSIYH